MAIMFDRFEVQGEVSKSETAFIYKALDRKTNQIVALKTQNLEPLGERAKAFVESLMVEGEAARNLANQNIAVLHGAGEIEGQFCAAMEYIEGNSVATMLARNEGFSIWDLLDITRQVCAAVGQAATLGVTHSSLEPAKIMVQWDGLVKVLGYGISNMSLIGAELGNGLGTLMPYCSPEQIRGEAIDQRSNLYTMGAILYEMVVGRKAFDGTDPVALVSQVENELPPEPSVVNPKVNPAVSAIVMKALAKDPEERYQTARELVDDLEKCKDGGKKAQVETKKPASPAIKIDPAARAAAAAKFTSAVMSASKPELPNTNASSPRTPAPSQPVAKVTAAAAPQRAGAPPVAPVAAKKVVAAAASSAAVVESTVAVKASAAGSDFAVEADLRDQLESFSSLQAGPSRSAPEPVMAAPALEPETESISSGFAVDPMMSGGGVSTAGKSFSDLDELPPLKEAVFTAPPPPIEQVAPQSPGHGYFKAAPKIEEKPRIQPRELAEKALKEVATIPPRLVLFSMLGAVVIVLVIAVVLFFKVHHEDDLATAAPRQVQTTSAAQLAAQTATPANIPAPPIEQEPAVKVRPAQRAAAKAPRTPAPAAAPQSVVIPGQIFVDSSPQGATFQLDGKSDPSWITPFSVAGLTPGKHIVAISKNGYGSEMRSLDVVSGGKATVEVHMTALNGLVVVNSTPPGAEITLDGKPTGRVTPAQFAVEKGSHTLLLKKQGFLDETTTVDLGPGQNFQYTPPLRALGNADEIRQTSKFHKLFGSGGQDNTTGMGTVSIKTTPHGAQIAINQRVLDKLSPTSVMVGPGNFIVDITLTGYKPIHKVISVQKGDRIAIDEILEHE